MNIVVLTGPYGHTMSPESSCIDKYLQGLHDDCNIHVICPKADMACYDNGKFVVYPITNFWNSLRVVSQFHLATAQRGIKGLFWNFMLGIVRGRGLVLSFFAFPTRNSWLIKKYNKKLKWLSDSISIDAIISVGGLPCAHEAASRFKKTHPSVKWVTYTLDPFTINKDVYKHILFKSLRKKRNHNLENGFWTNADWNIFTEELIDPMKEEFGDVKNNYICFPYVLQKPEFENALPKNKSDLLRAVYAGALYLHIRNPRRMLSVMSQVDNIVLDLYTSGECDGIIHEYVGERIQLHGKLSRNDYLELINERTDILINIGNSITLMAPSKYFEFLATGLPIINFYTVKNTNYYMTERYPLGLNIGPDDNDAVEKVNAFCQDVRGKRLLYKEIEALFPENSLTKQMLVLRQCLGIN